MKKFLAIGKHGPIDPAVGRKLAEQGVTWLPEQIENGFFDCVYSLKGGGRLVIANAESEQSLLAALRAAPDAERVWQITEMYDGLQVLRDYLAAAD
jgi:hypothetical protein